jgi:arylsulfatase A-like enzyme
MIPAALLVASIVCGCGTREPPRATVPAKPPTETAAPPLKFRDYNLVFVSFDALQARHVGALGNPRNVTPTIDSVAEQGYCFNNVYSVASWTVPASMTWFTGVYPSEHRMTNKFALYTSTVQKPANLKELAPNLVTLAEVLKRAGYSTGGFTGNAGVSGGFGYQQGFDTYYFEPGKFGGFDQSIPKAIEWLTANKQKKFFLFLHGYDCHGQHTPAHGFDYRYVDADYDRRYTGSELEQETLREEGLESGQLTLRDSDVRFWRAVYDEKINRADTRFREFLAEFDKLGLSEKTLFVLTSDHGTELYEHRRLDHGFTLYDEQLHVPLIIKLPGHPLPGHNAGRKIADRVSSIDLMPTILDLLDVVPADISPPDTDKAGINSAGIDMRDVKKQLRGTSLVPAMQGEPARRNCFSETDYREYTFKRSIIRPDGWKLIVTLETKSRELYDLNTDPGETSDLAASDPKLADDLQSQLFAHFQSIGCDLTHRQWSTGLNPVYPSQGKPRK